LIASRPDDPSGYVMATAWFLRQRDQPRAREAALRTPRTGLSPPLSHDLIEQLMKLGYRAEAYELVDATLRAHPDAAFARFDGLILRGLEGRFDEAFALARQLEREPAFCAPTRGWLEGWLARPELPEPQRLKLRQLLAELRCSERRR
jgi:hypothetical protein